MPRHSSTKRKKKKSHSPNPKDGTGQRIFFNRLYKLCKQSQCAEAIRLLTKPEKFLIYHQRIHFCRARAADGFEVPTKILRYFDACFSFFRNAPQYEFVANEDLVSTTELMTVYTLSEYLRLAATDERRQELEQAFHPLLHNLKTFGNPLLKIYIHYNLILLMENSCDQLMYGFSTSFKCRDESVIGLYHYMYLQPYEPHFSMAIIGGKHRPVYQVGWPRVNQHMNWHYLSVKKLGELYNGTKTHLPICIQAHALKRFNERCDAIEIHWNRIHMSASFSFEQNFCIFNKHLLFAYYYTNIKLGYFLGDIVGNRIIIRTFLFITHHNTPEGNKLEELSGLTKEDVHYWQMDRMTSFLNAQLKDYPRIVELFEAAGLSSLFDLRDKLHYMNQNNALNPKAFVHFIEQGQKACYEEVHIQEDRPMIP